MSLSKIISLLIKLLWIVTFFLIITIDRDNRLMVLSTILLLIIISTITIIRSINSRNEWRQIIDDGDVEIKDKIKFD
tara:strand:- start:214 stop:444 length:231 start_codon:yes stop_codon:yes gene_type:complete